MSEALVEFLRARLDEDEAVARATEHSDGPGTLRWRPGGARFARFDNDRTESYSAVFCGEWDRIRIARDNVAGGPLAEHIARHDPDRVLREVEGKRQILDEHRTGYDPCDAHDAFLRSMPCDTLRLIALPYADHPDYDEAWRP